MKYLYFITASLFILLVGCHKKDSSLHGKIKRETIAFSPKVTGRILKLYVSEGDLVKPGDTLAMLDVPEVSAKIAQAKGAVKATSAQHLLADNGVTKNQMKQLRAKFASSHEQYEFARKSYQRANNMFADSLMSPQAHDEYYAKYQSAKAQFDATAAELNEAETGTRFETKIATQGQQEQAGGVLEEIEVAYSERYVIATNYMSVETISLREGELAAAGFPLFNGYIPNSTWFRFTIPESQIKSFAKGQEKSVRIPYNEQSFEGKIAVIRQMPRYADITTAYPDYEMDDAIYEIKVVPNDVLKAQLLLYNATVTLDKP
ncbi:HlyD family secretion protein [Flavobacterium sp.]|uniref:HlyD family secretion protein n=1 Tax=Flavobacterium sp. TaxID=239 RepID=UPI0039E31B73